MSPRPLTRAKLRGTPLENDTCGRLAVENMERAGWQSMFNLPEPPDLTDLRALAARARTYRPTPKERIVDKLRTRGLALVLAPLTTPRLRLNRLELPE